MKERGTIGYHPDQLIHHDHTLRYKSIPSMLEERR